MPFYVRKRTGHLPAGRSAGLAEIRGRTGAFRVSTYESYGRLRLLRKLGAPRVERDQGRWHMSEERIDRRRILKRIGAGAAVAWTAPVITSIAAAPAFAASGPCDCISDPCNNVCNPGQGCLCAATANSG